MLATIATNNDVFLSVYERFVDYAAGILPGTFSTFIRAACILILQTLVCGAIFSHCRKNLKDCGLMPLQWLACLLVFFLAVNIPLEAISMSRGAKGFVLAVCLFSIAVLPWQLSFFLVPKAGHRKIVAGVIYGTLLILFIIQSLR